MFRLVQNNYSYMKLLLNSFFIFLFFISRSVYGENFKKDYLIKVSGIKIGELTWVLQINDNFYSNNLKLKSGGLLSAIYKFKGDYFSKGIIIKKKLKPSNYTHVWKTNRIEKNMKLGFENDKLSSLNQTPYEKEKLRIDVFNIKESKDPLSSFLEIIMGETNSLVIDGRRMYTMSSNFNKKDNVTVVKISNYHNLWADHKRSKFEQINFKRKKGDLFPSNIDIYFDKKVFKLEQN